MFYCKYVLYSVAVVRVDMGFRGISSAVGGSLKPLFDVTLLLH